MDKSFSNNNEDSKCSTLSDKYFTETEMNTKYILEGIRFESDAQKKKMRQRLRWLQAVTYVAGAENHYGFDKAEMDKEISISEWED